MANDLSRQLCELCGIEPVIEDSCKISDRYWKNSHKIKGIHDDYVQRYCPYDMECTAECEYFYEKQTYPDFTKPENFVRLLNLPTEIIIKNGRAIPAKNMWWIINMDVKKYGQLAPYYCDDFFIRLILLLQNENKYYNDELINRIKQSIREAEWVYE